MFICAKPTETLLKFNISEVYGWSCFLIISLIPIIKEIFVYRLTSIRCWRRSNGSFVISLMFTSVKFISFNASWIVSSVLESSMLLFCEAGGGAGVEDMHLPPFVIKFFPNFVIGNSVLSSLMPYQIEYIITFIFTCITLETALVNKFCLLGIIKLFYNFFVKVFYLFS